MPLMRALRRLLGSTAVAKDGELTRKTILAVHSSSSLAYDALPNPSEALKHYAPMEGIKYFARVRRQLGAVSGIVKLRIDALLSLPHTWIPGDVNDLESLDWAEGMRQCWKLIRERDIALRKLMFCIPDGLAIGELVDWQVREIAFTVKVTRSNPDTANAGRVLRTESWLVPTKIMNLPVEKFFFDRQGNLRVKVDGKQDGELVDMTNVIVARYGSTEPYGEGEQGDISTDAWKLDWIDRAGLEALDKSGYPMAQVTVPEHWDEERVNSTLAWAKLTYKNFMIVRMGDRFEVSFPDQSARPTFIGAEQVARIKQIEDSMSIGYLGVAFSNNQRGAKASDQVRNEMRFEKTSIDSAVYDELANQIEEKIRLINRPSLPEYKKASMVTDYQPTEDVATRANVFVQAAGIGYPISLQQFSEEFNLRPALHPKDRLQQDLLPKPGNPRIPMNQNIASAEDNDNLDTSSVNPN